MTEETKIYDSFGCNNMLETLCHNKCYFASLKETFMLKEFQDSEQKPDIVKLYPLRLSASYVNKSVMIMHLHFDVVQHPKNLKLSPRTM